MRNKWKEWLTMTLILALVCLQPAGPVAMSESALPEPDAGEESNWLDEVDGLVILDDPIYFMNLDEEEPIDGEETVTADTLTQPEESPAEMDTLTETEASTEMDTPIETETPAEVEAPAGTEAPTETDAPAETDVPAETGAPAETDAPAATETPGQPTPTPVSPTEPPAQTQEPLTDIKTLFSVEIKAPSAWRNSGTVRARIKITPSGNQMWSRVQYRIGNDDWKTVSDQAFSLYDGYYYADIEVSRNAELTVRVYGEGDTYFDTAQAIRVFDVKSPKVTAGFRELLLHVEAEDDLSGVAGIQVNSLLFTTLIDGKLDVRMDEALNSYKQLAIRAYDYAGNFSEPVTLDNPYYAQPTPTPKATAKPANKPTTKPTKKPSGSSGKTATATPAATATPVPTMAPTQQIVYVTPDPVMVVHPSATAVPETVYVPLGPGQPYKQEGNMQTLDMLYSAATNKQFITVQTRSGETYYLIIDYDKPIDEENDIYETYFLNLVDDRDLLSVIAEDELAPTPTPQVVLVTPEPTQPPRTTPVPAQDDGEADMTPALLLFAGLAAVGGAVFFLISKKKEKSAASTPDPDDVFDFEDDEEE